MKQNCKKCLLLEAGEKKAFENVKAYIDNLDDYLKVDDSVYSTRLDCCKKCEFLISGMCLKCGCYAEIRAVLKDKCCPDTENKKWNKI
ncbi:MAG: DUF6171 family protein [Eubacteriales bacterium]|nr:DUF6171 family protein [Eubacteriales bacterium]